MGTKKHYSFITNWQIQAPLTQVWEQIYQSETWPDWWKGVEEVREIVHGDKMGIGSIRTYTLSSPMRYRLRFNLLLEERADLRLLSGTVSGDLEGTGAWYFREAKGISYVECHWNVRTTVSWMNRLAFLLTPVFRYNHTVVMRWGAKCLARKLNARLISY